MALVPEAVEFHLEATSTVIEHMAELLDAGSGWITLLPGVDRDDLPPPAGGLFALFAGPRFDVPEATWMVPDAPGRPIQIGIRHAHGPKAVQQLAERGHPVPPGWRTVQDHPRRGLVVQVPAGHPSSEVLDWLLSAAILLTNVPLEEHWLAEIYRP